MDRRRVVQTPARDSDEDAGKPTLADYEKAWNRQLSGDPRLVFAGIIAALVLFLCLAMLPWVVSYLQDEELIKPRLQLRENILPPDALNSDAFYKPRHTRSQKSGGYNQFGRPRQE